MGSLRGARLSDFTFTFHFHALEKEMATHSSVLAWNIPGTGEPGGLPSMGSHRVGHDRSDLAAAVSPRSRGGVRNGGGKTLNGERAQRRLWQETRQSQQVTMRGLSIDP